MITFRPRHLIISILTAAAVLTAALITQPPARGQSPDPETLVSETPAMMPRDEAGLGAFPADPASDIAWSGGTRTVSDIQTAFNIAREEENRQLGTGIPMLTMPAQEIWDAMPDGEKALWLVNRERIDRGLPPLDGVEANVTSVARHYAEYLLENNAWGHFADGATPWERLSANPAIGACHDFLGVAENLAYFTSTESSIGLPVERSIYGWMYVVGDGSWEHRHAILWHPYNDNSGATGTEGFLGIGRASGAYRQWPFAEIIIMNVFDPCSSWGYGAEPPV